MDEIAKASRQVTQPTTSAKRRWLRFSLATLFVGLTVCGILLGLLVRELKTVKARGALRAEIESRRTIGAQPGPVLADYSWKGIPFWRRWLGDKAVYFVSIPADTSQSDIERVRDLFPESQIVRDED